MAEGMRRVMRDYYGAHAPKEKGVRETLEAVRDAFATMQRAMADYMDLVAPVPVDTPELGFALSKQRVTTSDTMDALAIALEQLDLTFRDTLMGMEEIVDTAAQACIHKAAQTAPPSIQRLHRMQKEAETAIVLDNPELNPSGAITMRREGPALF